MTMSHQDPVLPRYGAGSLSDIIPFLCSPVRGAEPPPWMPAVVHGAERVVLLLIDGLGWNQLSARANVAPTISSMTGGSITSVAPSTTATALTSLTTGLTPGEHGLIGYRMDMGGVVMNTLRWGDGRTDMRREFPPRQIQPCPPFLGSSVPVISMADKEGSGFTEAHLSGVKAMGWRTASSIPVTIERALADGERFVYAYYDGVDKIAHERGFGDYYDSELSFADGLVASIIERLPQDTVLLVTADHGQVHVGDNTVTLPPEVTELVRTQSGEGRFRWLHARRGREQELRDACARFEDVAWVVTRDRVVDEKWFGGRVSADALRRMGDVALVPFAPVSFEDPADGGLFDLVCRHGSLTADEMLVPLVAHRS
jgi:predicted AlkP superfamily pyrophosphatase or phosphodiesterase